jgi:hypothetical protein
MSTHDRIDRETAERMLRGSSADPNRVAEILAAAAAPPRHGEVSGEGAAVTAFRAARVDGAARARRGPRLRGLLSLRAAMLAAGVAVAGAGLVTVAATSPFGLPGSDAWSGGQPGAAGSSVSASPASSSTPPKKGPVTTATGSPWAVPGPGAVGLCRAYDSKGNGRGKALDSPAFQGLVKAAGGKEKVPAYCAQILSAKGSKGGPGAGKGKGKGKGHDGYGNGRGDDRDDEGGPGTGPGGGQGDDRGGVSEGSPAGSGENAGAPAKSQPGGLGG